MANPKIKSHGLGGEIAGFIMLLTGGLTILVETGFCIVMWLVKNTCSGFA